MDNNILEEKVLEYLRGQPYILTETDGYFVGEIYADYRDELDEKTAGEILQSEDPELCFEEKLDEWYWETAISYRDDLCKEVKKELGKDSDAFPDGLDDEAEEFIDDFITEHVSYDYPRDHFLDQELPVNIMLDTGEGNYDYTLNSVYPCWYGREGDRIDDKAGIVWLAKTQGYNKTQLWKALKDGDMADPKGFLQSMRVELANLPSHMSTVTFLTQMTLRDLLKLNQAVAWRDKQGRCYDARKHPYCGYIVLDKSTMCGLYDPWNGGGSVLEVELEKDVRLPIKYIRCALPDEGHWPHEYSIGSVYGLCGSAWRSTVTKIHVPKKVTEAA